MSTHRCNDTDYDLYVPDKSEENRNTLVNGNKYCLDNPSELILDGEEIANQRVLEIAVYPCKTGCLSDEEIRRVK